MKTKLIVVLSMMLWTTGVFTQESIRGTVVDKETFEPLIGAKVKLLNSDPLIGAVTDEQGAFRLENVPVGRQSIQITFIGYEPYEQYNIDVTTKGVVLNVEMVEAVQVMNKVEVVAEEKGEVTNKMATVSARSFSVEESQRYAGSKNDVARMAQNFAGVQGADDSRNDIIIRGNSPAGVLFRMEGIDIPNPNHFARFGTTGGPVSMLNNNVMANSDFMTGAFPSEYGNALAGVFDLKMRNGNNQQHEFMFQIGFNGAELMAEGPISKKKGSSYLVNYRYSTLGLFKLIGINFGSTAIPNYQDGSFKLSFPSRKGLTTVFGVGGLSSINILAEEADSSDLFALDYSNTFFRSNVGVVGVSHRQRVGNRSYFKISAGVQSSLNRITNDTVNFNFENPFLTYGSNSSVSRQTTDLFYNWKINAQHRLKVGLHTDLYFLTLNDSTYDRQLEDYRVLRSFDGNTFLYQPYVQYQWRATTNLTVNAGVHGQGLALNDQFVVEPRLGAAWKFTKKDQLSLGYGLHSQIQPLELYFVQVMQDGETVQPNRELGYSRSHHVVLGYQHSFKHGIRLKMETYYQYLFDIPVQTVSSPYSILNFGADFTSSVPSNLESTGTGENYGVELTVEKFLEKGFYFLVSSSLYEAFYTASDGNTYNSAFNGNYTFNGLMGYEFRFDEGKYALTLDLNTTLNGGRRYTPILLEESIVLGAEVRDLDQIYEAQYADYWRIDFRIAFKSIGKKVTQEWAIDMQNVTNRRNIFARDFDLASGAISETYQTGFLPIGQYRIYF